MKNLLRGAFLVSVLVMACVANVGASPWFSEYGTCYMTCHDGERYVQYNLGGMTSDECCAQTSYICPDNNYPVSVTWSAYEGWPVFCPPYSG